MTTQPQGFIAAAPPSRVVRAPATTLFDIAAQAYNDPMWWTLLASANGLTDPWLSGAQDILIPRLVSTAPSTGILGA